jgi:hypothetical protein
VLGGYNAKYVVGGATLHQMQSNILEWQFLPKDARIAKCFQTINEILNLPKFVDNPKTLCKIIREIYNLPDEELLMALTKSLRIKTPLEIALRKLYYVWHDLIEIFLAMLLEREKIKISTKVDLLSNIDLIKLERGSPELRDLAKKLRAYKHRTYCPHEPVVRILNLFTFPLQEVVTLMEKKAPELLFSIDLNSACKKITHIIESINAHRPSAQFKKRNDFSEGDSIDTCMEKFLSLYQQTYPILEKREQNYIESAKKIIDVCRVIEEMIVSITK